MMMDWLKQWSLYSPKAMALKEAESDVAYTYSTLYYLSCRLATRLREKFAVRSGDRVAVLATNEIEYVVLFFALQRLDAIMVPVNFRLTAPEISHILRDSSPKALIHQKEFQAVLEKAEASVVPDLKWLFDGDDSLTSFIADEYARASTAFTSGSDWALPMEGTEDSPSMILYTSGTTGAPKGALITKKMLHWNSLNTTLRLNLSQNDISLGFAPFFHTGGWNVLLTPFMHRGACMILMRKFEPQKFLEIVAKEKVTLFFGVPTIMEMMARAPGFDSLDLSHVRYAIVGGEPMPVQLIKTWEKKNIPIRQGYGLTEFGPNVFSLNEEDSIRKIGSIGFPNFYIEARVVDNSDKEVSAGEIGELVLRGPVCTPGYWNNPEATAQTIKNGWLHTGDLVRRDSEGYFYVAGRKKEMYISGGENVYPVEIERVLSTHKSIREVAVVGVPDPKWGEVGKAYVALKAGSQLSTEELVEFCATHLAKYKIPKQVAFLAELPKGDSGKILKRALL